MAASAARACTVSYTHLDVYKRQLDAKRLGLSIVAASHYATEFPVAAAVAQKLRAVFPAVEVLVSTANRDPFTYL